MKFGKKIRKEERLLNRKYKDLGAKRKIKKNYRKI